MRLGDEGSGNFEDRTGQSGFGGGGFGGGGNMLGCLLPFVLSRFGIEQLVAGPMNFAAGNERLHRLFPAHGLDDLLDERVTPIDQGLGPLARADARVVAAIEKELSSAA